MLDNNDETLYEKIISENYDKGSQTRLTVTRFRGVEYLSMRKYFLSYEGEWVPSKEGATVPATLESTFAILEGLLDICAFEENRDIVNDFLQKQLNEQNSRIPK